MNTAALALVALSLLASPLAGRPWSPACQGDVLAWHETSHDAAHWVNGTDPPNPFALWGDKWAVPGPQGAYAGGGLVGETWLAAATREPCLARAHTVSVGAYVMRAAADPAQSGDFDPWRRHRGQAAAGALLPALLIEAITEFERRP